MKSKPCQIMKLETCIIALIILIKKGINGAKLTNKDQNLLFEKPIKEMSLQPLCSWKVASKLQEDQIKEDDQKVIKKTSILVQIII